MARVQDRAYRIKIAFLGEGKKTEEKSFRCLVARSAQGAITKAFLRARSRKSNHENYGCMKMAVEIECLGPVER